MPKHGRITAIPPAFRGYRKNWLRGDVLAGITVAAYLVPQVMAYAGVAGLPRSSACGPSCRPCSSTP